MPVICYNISLTTIADAEWLIRAPLCVIDSSQQANMADSEPKPEKKNIYSY